jgi:hypothetical protein
MKTIEIYFSDLSEEKQKEFREKGLYHENIDICPIAIYETEEEE